jgi:Kef-type K+ transport system membrane component KefB
MSPEQLVAQEAPTLILIASAAFVLPLLSKRLRAPGVVLEILFGVMIGPVLGIVQEGPFLNELGELGLFLLMFLSGFEIDLGMFDRRRPRQLFTGLTVFALTIVTAFAASRVLGHGFFVMFILATTSVGLVVPTLRTTRRISTPLGQIILMSALLADFLTLLGVTAMAVVVEHGLTVELLDLPLFFVAVTVVLLVVRRTAWWRPEWFGRLFDTDDPEEVGIRGSLALMLVFVGLSLVLGIEPILGAFLAGSVFAVVFPHRGALEQKLSGFGYGFLIPIFFINVGIRFDLHELGEIRVLVESAALIGLAILVKLIPALVLIRRRRPLREVFAAGMLLSARLSLIIAVAELGVELGIIDRVLEAQIILLAGVTSTLAPAAFRALLPKLEPRSTET